MISFFSTFMFLGVVVFGLGMGGCYITNYVATIFPEVLNQFIMFQIIFLAIIYYNYVEILNILFVNMYNNLKVKYDEIGQTKLWLSKIVLIPAMLIHFYGLKFIISFNFNTILFVLVCCAISLAFGFTIKDWFDMIYKVGKFKKESLKEII